MRASSAEETVLAAIRSVETRDLDRLATLYDPGIAFDWPPGLPYSGHYEGSDIATMSERFAVGVATAPADRGGAADGSHRRRDRR